MNKLFKKISALLILLLVLNISSPVILATTDISKQDSSTKQKNVEFDAKLCTIAEDGNISSGNYEETFDIYTGGLLQITIRVKETGYLKGASIKFKNNNYIINDFSHIQIIKAADDEETEVTTSVQNVLNESAENIANEATETNVTEETNATNETNTTNTLTSTSTSTVDGENVTEVERNFELSYTSKLLESTQTETNANTISDEVVSEGANTINDEELEEAVEKAKSFDFETSSDAPILISEIEKETETQTQERMTGITRNENGEAIYSAYKDMSADKLIKEIKDDGFELNEIVSGRIVIITLPIGLPKDNYVQESVFDSKSEIEFSGTYINAKGKEKDVNKTLTEHVKWTANVEGDISQKVLRCIRYDGNKILLSMKINDQIKENKLPYVSKEININIPSINGVYPSNAIVTGNRISYEIQDTSLKITKDNDRNDKNALKWASDDTIVLTYIYTIEGLEPTFSTSSDIYTKIKLPINQEIQGSLTDTHYEITGEQGNIVDLTLSGPVELSKGLMYTNLVREEGKFDTNFYEIATINMGYNELIDKVELIQSNVGPLIVTKKVTISSEEFYQILGNDGFVNIYNEYGSQIASLNRDNLSVDINDVSNLRFETSKPIAEGNISLILNKAIPGDIQNATRSNINVLTGLIDKLIIKGYFQDTEISTNEINLTIKLTEPKSNAMIEISKTNLSTTEENNDVVITATLKTNEVNDALYKDPVLKISLPEDVIHINVKDAKLIFDDELIPTSYNADRNVITVNLSGTQTKYSTQAVSNGSVVKLVADITLNEYAYTKQSNISLNVKNMATGETAEAIAVTNVIAPEQFIMTNGLKISSGDNIVAKEKSAQTTKISEYDFNSKIATVTAHIVNNLGTDAYNISILGRFLSKDTSKPNNSGEDLNGTFDTTLNKSITVSGIESYKVFYSGNGRATNDLNNPDNGWSEQADGNSKSYLIVPLVAVPNGRNIIFSYESKIPSNVGYDQNGKETFAVYYDNQTMEGFQVVQGNKMANYCEVITGTKPFIETAITARNFDTNEEIFRDAVISRGDYIVYETSIINNSQGVAENVIARFGFEKARSDGNGTEASYSSKFVSGEYLENRNYHSKDIYYSSGIMKTGIYQPTEQGTLVTEDNNGDSNPDKEYFVIDVGSMNPGEIKTYKLYAKAYSLTEENTLKLTVSANSLESPSENAFKLINTNRKTSLELTKCIESNTSLPGSEIECDLTVKNDNNQDLNNVVLKTTLPEGISFASGDGFEYNEKKRTLSYKFNTIGKYKEETLLFKIKVNGDASIGTRYFNFNMEYENNGSKNSVNSNNLPINVQDSGGFNISVNSDKSNGKLLDSDTLDFTLSMQNTSGDKSKVDIDYPMSSQLYIEEINVQKGSEKEVLSAIDNSAKYTCELQKDESLVLTIKTKPKYADKNVTISNKPIVRINGTLVNVMPQTHEVIATIPSDPETSSGEDKLNSDSILGIVWNDKNGNGSRDSDEELIEGVELILYNRNTNTIAKDANGNEIKATSDKNGRYELNNIPQGNYYVVAKYDSAKYGITNYQDDKVTTALNSDFIEAMFVNERVGTSDIINVDNSNLYNFDLGLASSERFDLSLDMNITKVTVTNPRKKAESDEYSGSKLLKREFNGNRVDNDTLLVEYTIKVTNEGNLAGYASTIVDYIPDGFTFDSEINKDWFVGNDKNVYSNKLSGEIINPNESKELKIVFTKKMTGNSVGLIHNVAEITKAYNTKAISDSDSIPGNKKDGEDDISSADIFLGIETGAQKLGKLLLYVLGGLSVVLAGTYFAKQRYNYNTSKINKWKGKTK